MRVLLLGAGSTRAEAERKKKNGDSLPPLDKGFFSLAKVQKVQPGDFHVVDAFMTEAHGINVTHHAWDSVEAVMARIVADCELYHEDKDRLSGASEAFSALLRLYSRSLYESTHTLKPTQLSYIYSCITHWLHEGVPPSDIAVVTFNHDLEVEKALDHIDQRVTYQNAYGKLLSLPWSYGNAISALKRYGPGKTERFNAPTKQPDSFVKVLKLHGSLNWHSLHRATPGYDDLRSSERVIRWTSRKSIPAALTAKVGGTQYVTSPFVIPPIANKASVMPGLMTQLWDDAQEALEQAEHVTIFGYSCPGADTEAESLLRRSFRSNASVQLDIVNPDPLVVSRFADFAHGRHLRYFDSADSWVAALRASA